MGELTKNRIEQLQDSLKTVTEDVKRLRVQMLLIRLLGTFDQFLLELSNRGTSSFGADSVFNFCLREMREILADQDLLALDMGRTIDLHLRVERRYRFMRQEVPMTIDESSEQRLQEFASWNLRELTANLTSFWKQS